MNHKYKLSSTINVGNKCAMIHKYEYEQVILWWNDICFVLEKYNYNLAIGRHAVLLRHSWSNIYQHYSLLFDLTRNRTHDLSCTKRVTYPLYQQDNTRYNPLKLWCNYIPNVYYLQIIIQKLGILIL